MILAALLTLGPIVRATAPGAAAPQQVWAAADPRNARRLIACGRMNDPADNLDAGYVVASSDAGKTWKRALLENSTRWVSEESCAYANDGTAYFIAGASNYYAGEPHHETGHMHFYVSRDGGSDWSRTWTRKDGWLDWTSTAVAGSQVVVLANQGTDRLGQWLTDQPVAVVSGDGGDSFSKLVTVPDSSRVRTAVWIGGNVTLPDRTVLFSTSTATRAATDAGWGNGPVSLEVYAFDAKTQTLSSRAVLRTREAVPIFTSAIARSGSGRLYVAWAEEERTTSSLYLATSDDGGFHWKSRRIVEGAGTNYPAACTSDPPVDQVRLAAAGQNVGVAWIANRASVRFTLSRDGGATFAPVTTLASADTSTLDAFETLPIDDYWLTATLITEAGHPNPQAIYAKTPGISVVMGRDTLRDISLDADASGEFHAFWIAPVEGSFALFSRDIVASAGKGSASALFTTAGAAFGCASENAAALASPAVPSALPQLFVRGGVDVTRAVRVEPVRYAYDAATQTVSADVRVTGSGAMSGGGRLLLFGIAAHSDFGGADALNADGSIDGQPFWNVPAGKPVHVAVRIAHFKNLPSNYLDGDGFAMAIRVVRMAAPRQLSREANVLVSRDSPMGHTESDVAVNPLDSNDVVGGTTTFAGTDGALYDKTYASKDGGYTWNDTTPIEQRSITSGDPQVIFTNRGSALFSTINLTKLRIDVYRSTDGGSTWHSPARIPLLDHEVMAVDRSQGRYRGRIYLAGETTIHRDKSFMGGERVDYLFASDDDGRSFTRISTAADGKSGGAKIFDGGGVGAMALDVLADGTVVFNVARYNQAKSGTEDDYVATSNDGGKTFGPEVRVAQWFLYNDNMNAWQARYRELQSRGDVSGQGEAFAMDVDRSNGSHRDRIYVVSVDTRSGSGRIVYRYSSDRGKTWSASHPVAPQDGAQFQPAVATSANGNVMVTWFGTAGYPKRDRFNAYASVSTDGGASFSAPLRVSTAASMPKSAGNLQPVPDRFDDTLFFISAYSRWGAGGDYVGLAAGSDGVFHYYWPDARGSAYQIYSARLHAGGAGAAPATAANRDVTKAVTMIIDPIVVDPATNEVDLPIRLQNRSKNTIYGPVTVEFRELQNAQQVRYARIAPKARILNAANGKQGTGATFDYSGALGSYGALPPGAVTDAVIWRVHLSGITDLSPITIQVRVTARTS